MVQNTSCSILVVDDDKLIRRLCSVALGAAGYSVETACNGLDALEKIEGGDFSVILTDVNMPGLDGIGLYSRVVQMDPGAGKRFLFMTGNPSAGPLIAGTGRGFVPKPFRFSELLSQVELLVLENLEGPSLGRGQETWRGGIEA